MPWVCRDRAQTVEWNKQSFQISLLSYSNSVSMNCLTVFETRIWLQSLGKHPALTNFPRQSLFIAFNILKILPKVWLKVILSHANNKGHLVHQTPNQVSFSGKLWDILLLCHISSPTTTVYVTKILQCCATFSQTGNITVGPIAQRGIFPVVYA